MEDRETMGVTAQELTESMLEEENVRQLEESETLEAQIREGIGALFEDGWTAEELAALSQDEEVRAQIAAGKDVIRAAAIYLRTRLAAMAAQPARRRGVPVARVAAAGDPGAGMGIEQMTDAQFDAFSRQARAAAMMGKKVKM